MDHHSLGLSYGFHDSAICLINSNGEIVFSAQEERYSRIKNDSGFPSRALNTALNYLGINNSLITHIGYYENAMLKAARICLFNPKSCAEKLIRRLSEKPNYLNPLDDVTNLFPNAEYKNYYPHHLSHLASVLLTSNQTKAIGVVIDGVGEYQSTSIWEYSSGKITLIGETKIPDSIGLLYASITSFLGFKVNDGEYKVMGLASYGKPIFHEKIMNQIELLNDIKYPYKINQEFFDLSGGSQLMYKESLCELFGINTVPASTCPDYDLLSDSDFKVCADIAASIQLATEDIISHIFKLIKVDYNDCPIYYSGGVALNCKANMKLLANFADVRLQPACGDAGGAMGAALLAKYKFEKELNDSRFTFKSSIIAEKQKLPIPQRNLIFLGDSIENNKVYAHLRLNGVNNYCSFQDDISMLNQAAEDIQKNSIIGWFQGRLEWGPRSLGSRSILASPLGKDTQDRINMAVKYRERFRPFAPVILKSYFKEMVDLEIEEGIPHEIHNMMLSTVKLSEKSRNLFPACTHIDGTARIQVVDDQGNLKIAMLLKQLAKNGHPPVLVNTSFNVKGEPIVGSITDAITTFFNTELDYLYIENNRISREDL